ncbi:MAG: hypothetical protein WCT77_06140 [Bacteroidota bacterium]
MKQYSLRVKILAMLIIGIECFVLLAGFGYVVVTLHQSRFAKASVSRINKNNVVMGTSANLKHFYEWGANQNIIYNAE